MFLFAVVLLEFVVIAVSILNSSGAAFHSLWNVNGYICSTHRDQPVADGNFCPKGGHLFAASFSGESTSRIYSSHSQTDELFVHKYLPTRCSSHDAAYVVKNCTGIDEGLLIISCDASGRGGGSKHDGIAAVLRVRHGASPSSNINSSLNNTLNRYDDLIDFVARRTVPSRTSSEVAAIALGVKRALERIPLEMRKKVLILTDSEYALNFYCGHQNSAMLSAAMKNDFSSQLNGSPSIGGEKSTSYNTRKRNRKSLTSSKRRQEESYCRSMSTLMQQTPNGVLFSKVRSSSRGVGVNSILCDASADSVGCSSCGGFIDHDAADYLSSATRAIPNKNDDSDKTALLKTESYGDFDVEWLANSDSNQMSGFWRSFSVDGREAREERLKRNNIRIGKIREMLGSI